MNPPWPTRSATLKHEKRFRFGRERALSAGPGGTPPDNIRLAGKTACPTLGAPLSSYFLTLC